jgi:dimeric dUTPase (all-alpha-NTP-PPase superfamily)
MDERLSELLQHQLDLQRNTFKVDPTVMTDDERLEYLRFNVLALEDELHEMLNETSWKPWTRGSWINELNALGELADAWHFFLNIMLVLRPQEGTFALASRFGQMYADKRSVNAHRQANDDDGVNRV